MFFTYHRKADSRNVAYLFVLFHIITEESNSQVTLFVTSILQKKREECFPTCCKKGATIKHQLQRKSKKDTFNKVSFLLQIKYMSYQNSNDVILTAQVVNLQ